MFWILTIWPPLVLLFALVGGAVYAGRRGDSRAEISRLVQRWFPGLLALALSVVGVTLLVMFGQSREAWVVIGWGDLSSWQRDLVLGGVVGALLAGLYFVLLSPILIWLQKQVGDYVPPGSVLATLEGHLPAFFVANVLLAPLVEEVWYRGALYSSLEPLGPVPSVILTCLAFGLFHWPGGVWYMLATGGIVGGALMWLRIEQAGLLAPYLAHLTLNTVEFYVLARRATEKPKT